VTGLFTAPYRGACEDGVTGFVGGMFKGVTGVVTKPLAGVLDATAKAA
jgi:vacuolar protein sorting-associated protein 13A/C